MKYWMRDLGVAALALALVHACGGGGDDASSGTSVALPTAASVQVANQFAVDCSGSLCAASNEHTYSGSGTGVWFYRNSTTSSIDVPISIAGLSGQTVTLVYTNEGASAAAMPSLTLSQNGAALAWGVSPSSSPSDPAPASIREENAKVLDDLLNQRASYTAAGATRLAKGATVALSEGATRTIVDPYRSETIALTLRKRVATLDGAYKVNFWVDDNEYGSGKVSAATLEKFASYFASTVDNNIYSLATGLIGKPWGAHDYVNLIDSAQDLNIVFYNSKSAGWAGYYAASDQIFKSWFSRSNEWLALYLASDSLYDNNASLSGSIKWATSTLAHELTHMIHFYQRGVLKGSTFDLWLNEMVAMGMEDIVDTRILGESYSTTQIMHYPNWLSSGNFNCQLTTWIGLGWSNGCNSYAVAGSFGAFLLRQYGIAYYKALFTSAQTASLSVLNETIINAGGSGYQDALRRWGASLAMFPLDTSPAGHGYPRRLDSGFDLAGFNGSTYRNTRVLPTAVPASLAPLAHFPLQRSRVSGIYRETLSVPPSCSLTVVIQ